MGGLDASSREVRGRAAGTSQPLLIWLKAARAPFLVVSLLPCALGGLVARRHGPVDLSLALLLTLGVVLAQAAANLIDDFFDFRSGNLANKSGQFHPSPLIDGEVTTRQVLAAAALCSLGALACGLAAFASVGWPVAWMTLAGALLVVFYTAPPLALNQRGLGELALFVAFGPLAVAGVAFVLSREWRWEPLLLGIPVGLFTMNVGLVSNTFDHDDDIRCAKRTLAVRFGQRRAVGLLAAGYGAGYALLLALALTSVTPLWTLLALPTAALVPSVLGRSAAFRDPAHFTPAMTAAIGLASAGSVLLCLGYVLAIALR